MQNIWDAVMSGPEWRTGVHPKSIELILEADNTSQADRLEADKVYIGFAAVNSFLVQTCFGRTV